MCITVEKKRKKEEAANLYLIKCYYVDIIIPLSSNYEAIHTFKK